MPLRTDNEQTSFPCLRRLQKFVRRIAMSHHQLNVFLLDSVITGSLLSIGKNRFSSQIRIRLNSSDEFHWRYEGERGRHECNTAKDNLHASFGPV